MPSLGDSSGGWDWAGPLGSHPEMISCGGASHLDFGANTSSNRRTWSNVCRGPIGTCACVLLKLGRLKCPERVFVLLTFIVF